jgi:chaperonin GroES
MDMNYKPLGDRVVIEIVKRHDEKTKGGLYKPSGSETTMLGEVIAIGGGLFTHTGDRIPMSVTVGDMVLLEGTGFKHKNGGKTYHIYRESELLAILNENVTD